MEAGRELDALVAEKVMGLDCSWRCVTLDGTGRDRGPARRIKPYSTNIDAAWEVVEKLKENHTVNIHGYSDGWEVGLIGPGSAAVDGQAETAPHAICLAALKAVGHN